jgi:gamma-glutamyl hercynylcysteine S-oxide synthase
VCSQTVAKLEPVLLSRIDEARRRTDSLFHLLPPNSFYERPIPERHRLIFYLGHLEAFEWNLLAPPLGLTSQNLEFDRLFAFGIDPLCGALPTDRPGDWPNIARVEKYSRNVREALDAKLAAALANDSANSLVKEGTLLNVAVEHRLMHAETLAYILHNMPIDRKMPHPGPSADFRPAPKQRSVRIPEGLATLGQAKGSRSFGWDNEFDAHQVFVPGFSIDAFPVTNGGYLKFVHGGGYADEKFWRPEDWEWKRERRLEHPHFWLPRSSSPPTDPDTPWEYRTMFGTIPLPRAWPVLVSYAEAFAFAKWAGRTLPTEAQWHRAAYGTPEETERPYPWGEEPPDHTRGNFHHKSWDLSPVDAHPSGASAFGVHDLVGNGWEWTSTPFGPLPGFEPFSFYPGYSTNFFDGQHFVMKGGSPRTDACMLRRPFRNWFQPHYPYVYATFRCAGGAA